MKTPSRLSSILTVLSSAALLAAPVARAAAPRGWDVEHEQPRLGEAPMVIHFAPPQDPDYQVVPAATPADQAEDVLAGGGGGEPRDTRTVERAASQRIERIFSEP